MMMTAKIHHYLIMFDRSAGKQVSIIDFVDSKKAIEAYNKAEEAHQDEPHMDIVLLGSDSVETLQKTHANYFPQTKPDDILNAFAGLDLRFA